MSEWATKRLDVEASLAVSTAMASQQVDEMARYLDDAYAKIEALQNQTNLLNEEANTLNEENDRLAAQVAERNESIVGLREQVQELGNTIVHLENERQNNSFSRHMSTLDASSHHRMQSRLNRSSRGYFAPSKHRSCAPLPETVKPSPTLAPPHESDSYASLRRQRDNLIALQNGGVIGLESALSAIEAKLDALQCSLPLDGTASPIARPKVTELTDGKLTALPSPEELCDSPAVGQMSPIQPLCLKKTNVVPPLENSVKHWMTTQGENTTTVVDTVDTDTPQTIKKFPTTDRIYGVGKTSVQSKLTTNTEEPSISTRHTKVCATKEPSAQIQQKIQQPIEANIIGSLNRVFERSREKEKFITTPVSEIVGYSEKVVHKNNEQANNYEPVFKAVCRCLNIPTSMKSRRDVSRLYLTETSRQPLLPAECLELRSTEVTEMPLDVLEYLISLLPYWNYLLYHRQIRMRDRRLNSIRISGDFQYYKSCFMILRLNATWSITVRFAIKKTIKRYYEMWFNIYKMKATSPVYY